MPPWWTAYHYFRKWINSGLWEQINDQLRQATRVIVEKKNDRASAAVFDSQSIKSTEAGELRGYDAGKNVNGRKRHIVVDTNGLLLSATVHEANIQDRDGASQVLTNVAEKYPDLKLIWAGGGYAGRLVQWVDKKMPFKIEITKRPDDAKGFVVVRRRWVVERTFGWLGRDRRHSKDYERQPKTGEALINASVSRLMLHRLTAGA